MTYHNPYQSQVIQISYKKYGLICRDEREQKCKTFFSMKTKMGSHDALQRVEIDKQDLVDTATLSTLQAYV